MVYSENRWKQRFGYFETTFFKLQNALKIEKPNSLECCGIIYHYKFTIDLSWKVLKDYLEEKGFVFKPSPKDTIREAQRAGLIDFGQALIDGLDIRNDLSHDYSGNKFEQSETILRDTVFPALNQLNQFFILEGATE